MASKKQDSFIEKLTGYTPPKTTRSGFAHMARVCKTNSVWGSSSNKAKKSKTYHPRKVNYKSIKQPTYKRKNQTANQNQGCYVATCIYGSYDCPQVWVLRRFRDFTLNSTRLGKAFIKMYYSISPVLVKWFGNKDWFRLIWKIILDRMVSELRLRGYTDTPYFD